jgi:hypothetical protein
LLPCIPHLLSMDFWMTSIHSVGLHNNHLCFGTDTPVKVMKHKYMCLFLYIRKNEEGREIEVTCRKSWDKGFQLIRHQKLTCHHPLTEKTFIILNKTSDIHATLSQ